MFSSSHLIRACLRHPCLLASTNLHIMSSNVNVSAAARQSSLVSVIEVVKVDYAS